MAATRPDWYLDELAHAGAEHLDADYVAGYERKAGYDPEPDLDELARHGFGAGSLVVDLGAGTGAFAAAAARRSADVVAVDVSAAMVDVLESRVRTHRLDNLTVVHAGYLTYEHDGRPADFLFSRNALHQVPDFWKGVALSRAHAMLRPGGVFRLHDLVFDFEPGEADEAIAGWTAGAVDDPARGWTAAELHEHVRTEHSTFRWLFEPLLERVGFEILDAHYVRRAYGAYTLRRA